MKRDIRFLVTNKCNYNCVFCHNEGEPKQRTKQELDVEDYLFLFDTFFKITGWNGVTISGGEPFIFKDIDALIQKLYEHGAKITIVTNGSLLNLHENILQFVDRINVSIHSLDENKYTSITQSKVQLTQVKENLKLVSKNHPGLSIRINTTPCKSSGWNDNIMNELIEYSKQINASIKFTELFPAKSEDCINKQALQYNLEKLGYRFCGMCDRSMLFKRGEHCVYITQCTCSKAIEFDDPIEYCAKNRDLYVNHDGSLLYCMIGNFQEDCFKEIKNKNENLIRSKIDNSGFMVPKNICKAYLSNI